jgi:hypothetical protein
MKIADSNSFSSQVGEWLHARERRDD